MLRSDSLVGAMVYYDGAHNDSRTNIALALTAATYGATVANHVEVRFLPKLPCMRARVHRCRFCPARSTVLMPCVQVVSLIRSKVTDESGKEKEVVSGAGTLVVPWLFRNITLSISPCLLVFLIGVL